MTLVHAQLPQKPCHQKTLVIADVIVKGSEAITFLRFDELSACRFIFSGFPAFATRQAAVILALRGEKHTFVYLYLPQTPIVQDSRVYEMISQPRFYLPSAHHC